MDIQFKDQKLQKLCEQAALAKKSLGADCAKKLQARLSNLMAAQTVGELIAGNPHPLKGDRSGQFSLKLHGGKRLVFEPAEDPVPLDQDGAIAWSKVTQIRIIFIGDYHDD